MTNTSFDLMDLAGLQAWKNQQGEDNHLRMERLLGNLNTAMSEELTPRQRQMLQMHFFQGKTVTAIAAELDLSKSTVSRTISRSIDKLFHTLRYSL